MQTVGEDCSLLPSVTPPVGGSTGAASGVCAGPRPTWRLQPAVGGRSMLTFRSESPAWLCLRRLSVTGHQGLFMIPLHAHEVIYVHSLNVKSANYAMIRLPSTVVSCQPGIHCLVWGHLCCLQTLWFMPATYHLWVLGFSLKNRHKIMHNLIEWWAPRKCSVDLIEVLSWLLLQNISSFNWWSHWSTCLNIAGHSDSSHKSDCGILFMASC